MLICATWEVMTVNPETLNKVIVAVKQRNLLGTAFHPELTADNRWHLYFIKMVNDLSEETETLSSIIKVGDLSTLQDPKIELPIYLP
ncbi:putative pyridoxal 5'-phosphate synthase subunit PDX2 [Bienertia sinuspersici]